MTACKALVPHAAQCNMAAGHNTVGLYTGASLGDDDDAQGVKFF